MFDYKAISLEGIQFYLSPLLPSHIVIPPNSLFVVSFFTFELPTVHYHECALRSFSRYFFTNFTQLLSW